MSEPNPDIAATPVEPSLEVSPETPEAGPTPAPTKQVRPVPTTFSGLPPYSRSLLKVEVPVRVVLASRKEVLKDVVELSPGTIIKFDKPCDELLQLYVGNQRVAEGEAVKVGDKFGYRVLSMLMPEEHFFKVSGNQAS